MKKHQENRGEDGNTTMQVRPAVNKVPKQVIDTLRGGTRRCIDDEVDNGNYRKARAPTLSQMDGFDPFDD